MVFKTKFYTLAVYIFMRYNFAMIKIRLRERLWDRKRTMYWLSKQAGVRYATVWNMGRGRTDRLSLDALDRICEALECQPGDLLTRVSRSEARKPN
jgi:putative transcriptional regulator